MIVEPDGLPVAMVTDRDLTTRVLADGSDPDGPMHERLSRPLVSGEPEMELEEAAALMVQHRVRRLPVVDRGELAGIVTLDDIAVRTGNLEVAQRMTQEVIEGALPQFFFHQGAQPCGIRMLPRMTYLSALLIHTSVNPHSSLIDTSHKTSNICALLM